MKLIIASLVLLSGLAIGVACFAGKVDISGIDKKVLLNKLYKKAKRKGMGRLYLYYPHPKLTDEEIEEYLKKGHIDSINGMVMEMDISGPLMETSEYNRNNGLCTAEDVIEGIKNEHLIREEGNA